MNTDNRGGGARALLSLTNLPQNQRGAVFDEPWHAEVFSIVHVLVDRGQFTLHEWAEMLGAVIKEQPDHVPYYECWLMALERISLQKGLVERDPLHKRKIAWDRAAKATPHGEAIVLGRDEQKR